MRREDILALAEENRRLRQEIYRLEEELISAHQEEAEVLRDRLSQLETKIRSPHDNELQTMRGALAAVIAGVALSLGLAGGLASLLFSATQPKSTPTKISPPVAPAFTKQVETSSLFVSGEPVQAKILLDGVLVGESPLLLTISPGHHKLDIVDNNWNTIDRMEFFAQPNQTTRATYHTNAKDPKVPTGACTIDRHEIDKHTIDPL
jgi:hypothetical protein